MVIEGINPYHCCVCGYVCVCVCVSVCVCVCVCVPKGAIVAMLDARRQEVYSAIFDDHFSELRSTEAEVLTPESYQELLESSLVYFIGNGVAKTKMLITHKNTHFIEDKLPSAQQMCALSFEKYKAKNFEDVAYFEPFYLKDFIAIPSKK